MTLPLRMPFAPMEALSVDEIPVGPHWQYEPKWDGFRCLAFRDGGSIYLQSKSGQPLARYFPDLTDALLRLRAKWFVLDGEIVIPVGGRTSFEVLLLRVHPAASRVQKLAKEHPCLFAIFDLLVDERGRSLVELPLAERRPRLEQFAKKYLKGIPQVRLSPATTKLSTAKRWFASSGASLDGIVAKRLDLPYLSASRDGMQKVKRQRTADCVVGGFRYSDKQPVLGSLLLGLYDDAGQLDHVGFTSGFSDHDRHCLLTMFKPLVAPPGFTGKAPGGPSRWSTRRSRQWQPVKPKVVVEVQYDQFSGNRFRHGTRFLRFRPDKRPRDCTFGQIDANRGAGLRLLAKRQPPAGHYRS